MNIPNPLGEIKEPLLAWYRQNARTLPWRENPTPYRVWISEIMLQQTRVEAGKPYFERFVAQLPDIAALAQADEALLLKLWEGLGYYSRVRNLQKAAKMVMERYGGKLPEHPAELRKLPGIGPYTAGAIASIAFGNAAPAVDGNVLRVFARLLDDNRDIGSPPLKKEYETFAAAIIPPGQAGDFNQALMELGALVCLPGGTPLCANCPLAHLCQGRASGNAPALPIKVPKAPRREETHTILRLECDGQTALRRRPPHGLLASLWELPEAKGLLTAEEAIDLIQNWGLKPLGAPASLGQARHIFTHVQWEMMGWVISVEQTGGQGLVWATPNELTEAYSLPSAFRIWLERTPNNN